MSVVPREEEDEEKTVPVVHVMFGSQFSAKVVAALDNRGIKHYAAFAPVDRNQRNLKSGGYLLPEMDVGEVNVPDSEAILKWFDKNRGTDFFPTEETDEISKRAGSVLNAFLLYYNWVNDEGFARSMLPNFARQLPSWMCCCRDRIIRSMSSAQREEFRVKVRDIFSKQLPELVDKESASELADETKIAAALGSECERMQALLERKSGQQYLVPEATNPTAADFTVYCIMSRIFGEGEGTGSGDAKINQAVTEAEREDYRKRFPRLFEYFDRMLKEAPIKYKGKRVPRPQA